MDNDYWDNLLEGLGPVEITPGGSGYFSSPDSELDPRLFDGTTIRPSVRSWILATLYDYWAGKFDNATSWSQAWIAGSGISYQWAADRSNGDLDVLIGIDWPKFYASNPDFVGTPEGELADYINNDLRTGLWSRTDRTIIGTEGEPNGRYVGTFTGVFEVTFYCNPNSTDIRDIHPYAAYNLTTDEWTVHPPELPENPESLYPQQYWDHVEAERGTATGLVEKYNRLSGNVTSMAPHTPGWINSLHEMGLVIDQAKALFDDIHLGRRKAFGPDGAGYGDFYNFRWQAHKRYGTVQALNALSSANKGAQESLERSLYGQPLQSASEALTTASLWNTSHRNV